MAVKSTNCNSCDLQLSAGSLAPNYERCGAGGAGLDRSKADLFAVKGVFMLVSGWSMCGDMGASTGGATGERGGGDGAIIESIVASMTEFCMNSRVGVGAFQEK